MGMGLFPNDSVQLWFRGTVITDAGVGVVDQRRVPASPPVESERVPSDRSALGTLSLSQVAAFFGARGVIIAATPAATTAAILATMRAAVKPFVVPPARLTAATLDITAAPTDAPNSWNVLTMPDAMPAS